MVLYFFARQSHQSCLIPWSTASEWLCFISSMPGCLRLINHVSSHDQQGVSDIALFFCHQSCLIPWPTASERPSAFFVCQAVSSIISHPMTNIMWVTLLYFFARQSHQSCIIPCPTGSEWHCFISESLPGSLINHVLASHDQQGVSDIVLFFCQTFSSVMSQSMTNRRWGTTLFLCQAVSSIISHPMTNRMWVDNAALFLCQAVSSIMFHTMTNSMWVMLLYFSARQSHQSCLIPWTTGSEWHCFISLPSSLIYHVPSHNRL